MALTGITTDTEDCSNYALITGINHILQYIQ